MRWLLGIGVTFGAISAAFAQYGGGFYAPRGPYIGVFAGPAFGYVPSTYGGFWSNGFSLYGPPVPTYGSIPGFFGGADQRLSNFPDLRYGYYGPWGLRGGYIPLDKPAAPVVPPVPAAVCEVQLPTPDTELFLNGAPLLGSGVVRRFRVPLPPNAGTTYELEARWTSADSIGSARRSATLRAGEMTTVDFTTAGG